MAHQADRDSKTEEPTEKKIFYQIERGNLPVSREASLFATSASTLLVLVFLARDVLKSITFPLQQLSNDPSGWSLYTPPDAIALFTILVWEIGRPLIPVIVILTAAGLASTFLQHAPRIVVSRIQPDFARISLINGWRRIFSAHGKADFLKSVGKLISITIVLLAALRSQRDTLIGAMSLDPRCRSRSGWNLKVA